MSLYRVNHTTVYRFDGAARVSDCRVVLRPRDTERQRCGASRVFTVPPPTSRGDELDAFGNHVSRFSLRSPTSHLEIKAVSTIQASPDTADREAALRQPWRDLRIVVGRGSRHGDPRRRFLADSRLVTATSRLRDYAEASFAADRPIGEALFDLMARLRRDLRYAPRANDVTTTAEQALARRAGVCQDFAHVTIGCLHALALPARYVGGYLARDDKRPAAAGAEAAHAWCSLPVPGAGWVDFDPTHGRLCGSGYITVAWGRDYADVSPVRGAIRGGRLTYSAVAIDIESGVERAADRRRAPALPVSSPDP